MCDGALAGATRAMRTLGIVGGIAPESTIDYYRSIVQLYRERRPDGSYPPIMINSIDLTRMLGLIGAEDLKGTTQYHRPVRSAVAAKTLPRNVLIEIDAVALV